MAKIKVISGGQTGVDRGAIDAARKRGLSYGGFCPAGRKAEDGRIPDEYELVEAQEGDYKTRTRMNVEQSHVTFIIYRGQITGGTKYTLNVCDNTRQPAVLINLDEWKPMDAAKLITQVMHLHPEYRFLNFAGPRESKQPGIQFETEAIVGAFLDQRTADLGSCSFCMDNGDPCACNDGKPAP